MRFKRLRFDPWVGKLPWQRKWQPTPVFLPGESSGQRSLVGYSLWSCKESDTTEHKHTYVESKIQYKQTYLQSRNRLIDIENRLVVAKWGGGRKKDGLGV